MKPQQLDLESQSTHRSGQKGWQQPSHNPDAVSREQQGTVGLTHLPLDRKPPPLSHPPILYPIPGKPNKETYIVNIKSKWMWTAFGSRPKWGPWAGKLKQRKFPEVRSWNEDLSGNPDLSSWLWMHPTSLLLAGSLKRAGVNYLRLNYHQFLDTFFTYPFSRLDWITRHVLNIYKYQWIRSQLFLLQAKERNREKWFVQVQRELVFE